MAGEVSAMCVLFGRAIISRVSFRAVATLAIIIPAGLSACSVVGPASIGQGRTPYNEVIHDTSTQQTLLNLIRVKNGESPLFMDVTEVDAASTLTETLNGGPSGLGSIPNYRSTSAGTINGAVGFLTGGVAYQDAPTVRYQPLSGQALIAQVSTPLTAESLANLYNSDWPLAALLPLSVDRITPNFGDYYAAVNAIIELDAYGALIIEATQNSDDNSKKSSVGPVTLSLNQPQAKDSLAIYLEKKKPISQRLECYNIQKLARNDAELARRAEKGIKSHKNGYEDPLAEKIVQTLWDKLRNLFPLQTDRNVIVISTKSAPRKTQQDSPSKTGGHPPPPTLTTRSALGIMRFATQHFQQEDEPIIFISDGADDNDEISRLVETKNSQNPGCKGHFYILDPRHYLEYNRRKIKELIETIEPKYSNLDAGSPPMTIAHPELPRLGSEELDDETKLGLARRFMLISKSDVRPTNAFVAVEYRGSWYYILENDEISKNTLALITQLNTIQAVPSQSPALTPSISVGPR